MIFSTGLTIFLISLSLFTAFLSGIAGMAGGMVLMGAMIWVLPVSLAMILHGTTQLVSNGYRAFLHRQHIIFNILGYYILGLVAVLIIFQILSVTVSRPVVFIALGALPLIAYIPKRVFHVDILKKKDAFICGCMVTFLQLTAGVSGSALDIFFLNRNLTRHQVIATKALTQSLGHLTKLYYFGLILKIESDADFSAIPAVLIPGLTLMTLVGTTLSKSILKRISDHQFHTGTRLLVTCIGLIYLWKGINLLLQ